MNVSFANQIQQSMRNNILVALVAHAMTHKAITRANAILAAGDMVKVTKGVSSYFQDMQYQF